MPLWAPELPVDGGRRERRTSGSWLWHNADDGGDDRQLRTAGPRLWTLIRQRAESFDLVLLDEAQRIKNRGGVTSQVVRALDPRSGSWALTGTPIENSTDDLVGIFEFVSPGCLAPADEDRARSAAPSRIIVLRRTKDQVLDGTAAQDVSRRRRSTSHPSKPPLTSWPKKKA